MTDPVLQLIGLCRFSYRTAEGSGFAATSGIEDLARLTERLSIFRRLWLPSMAKQIDKRFKVIILVGTGLPQSIRAELEALIAGTPEIILHTEKDGQTHNEICSKVLRHYRTPGHEFIGEFGMDDDDAVALDFVELVHRRFATLHPLISEVGRIELDFSRGYAAHISGDVIRLKEVVSPHWNCGQVILQRLPTRLSLFNFRHTRFWMKHPCLLDTREPMFIRSFHGHNDSGDRWEKMKAEATALTQEDMATEISRRFDVEISAGEGVLTLC